MATLVIAEQELATRSAVAAAQQLSLPVDVLVMGQNCQAFAKEISSLKGVSRVFCVDDPLFSYLLAENCAEQILAMAKDYSHIVATTNTLGKGVMPRVAARLDVELISEVIRIEDDHTFLRPIYAGNAILKAQSDDPVKVITIRTVAFDPVDKDEPKEVIALKVVSIEQKSVYLSHEENQSKRPDLAEAKIIVSGGQGIGSQEDFQLIENLADQLGAAIGASRAAVDAGYVKNDLQIGQTGKIVAPELYIAVGISGAIQHVAGIKDAKTIVAINQDPDAPIFSVADYGMVGDLYQIVPELTQKLK